MASPGPRGSVKIEGGEFWASCRRCTWEHGSESHHEAFQAAERHVGECGRTLYLRPAQFTHRGDSSPIPIPVPTMDEIYGEYGTVLAVGRSTVYAGRW